MLWAQSPSSLTLHDDCPRKWYYKYVLKRQEPDTAAKKLGTDVHNTIDKYLQGHEGVLGPLGLRLQPWLEPMRRAGKLSTERVASFVYDGQKYKGRLDAVNVGAGVDSDGNIEIGDIVDVTDHKTGKRAYAKSTRDLANDLAGIFYAYYAVTELARGLPVDRVYFAHNFTATDRAFAQRTRVLLAESVEELRAKFDAVVAPVAQGARRTAALKTVDACEPNFATCDKYGGCYVRNICTSYRQNQLKQHLQGAIDMSLLDTIDLDPETAEAVKALDAGQWPRKISDLICALWDARGAYPAVTGELAEQYAKELGEALPTDGFPGEGQLAGVRVADYASLAALVDGNEPSTPAPAPAPVEVAPPPPPPAEEKRRGRPRKTSPALEQPDAPAPAAEPPPRVVRTETPAPAGRATHLAAAYVDCIVTGAQVISVDELALKVLHATKKAFDVKDLRLKDDESVSYGRWRAVLQAAFADALLRHVPAGSSVSIQIARSALWQPFADALRELAATFVQGAA